MKYNLIMLPNPILVSDEKQNKDDFVIHKTLLDKIIKAPDEFGSTQEHWFKIIAGIPNLPSFRFADGVGETIGIVDVGELCFKDWYNQDEAYKDISERADFNYGFHRGFKSAQSLRKGFSEEDVIEFLGWTKKEDIEKNAEKYFHYSNLDMLQLWKQSRHPIDYEVELEMEVSYCQNHFNETEEMITKPKLTNNSYTIIKIIK